MAETKLYLKSLINIIKPLNPSSGAEIGVWRGDASMRLLATFPFMRLYMVDSWKPMDEVTADKHQRMAKFSDDDIFRAFLTAREQTLFAQHRRTILGMTSAEALQVVPYDLDFVFIDAAHDYDNVKHDVTKWYEHVRPGGVLCGHDYNGKGDRTGKFGVKKAVDEFAASIGAEVSVSPGLIWHIAKKV